jgi:hypothetical protein
MGKLVTLYATNSLRGVIWSTLATSSAAGCANGSDATAVLSTKVGDGRTPFEDSGATQPIPYEQAAQTAFERVLSLPSFTNKALRLDEFPDGLP